MPDQLVLVKGASMDRFLKAIGFRHREGEIRLFTFDAPLKVWVVFIVACALTALVLSKVL
jgi:hypothetical protein